MQYTNQEIQIVTDLLEKGIKDYKKGKNKIERIIIMQLYNKILIDVYNKGVKNG